MFFVRFVYPCVLTSDKAMQKTHFLLCLIVSLSVIFSSISSVSMADSSQAKVHIIYTERPKDQEPEEYHIQTLTHVLGSEEAAKESLLYSYKHAASGFSAKLTPDQVSEISKQPGVLQVVPSETLQLHSTHV